MIFRTRMRSCSNRRTVCRPRTVRARRQQLDSALEATSINISMRHLETPVHCCPRMKMETNNNEVLGICGASPISSNLLA
jgi:hypothetical protein